MKKLIAFLLAAVMCLSLVACGTQDKNTDTKPNSDNSSDVNTPDLLPTVDSSNDNEIAFDSPITILDNEYVKVVATGKFAKSELMFGLSEAMAYGYNITIENKTNQYINLFLVDSSIDGFMLEDQDYCRIETANIGPGKKANTRIVLYADMVKAVELKTIDDLKNLDALVQTGFSDDGNSYGDIIKLNFENVLP